MRDILLPHLLRAEAIMFSTMQTGHARWVANFILAHGVERLSVRDVVQAYRPLRAPEQRRELLEVIASLEAVASLRPEPQKDGRPPTWWRVNPAVHDRFAAQAKRAKAGREATKARIHASVAKHFGRPRSDVGNVACGREHRKAV